MHDLNDLFFYVQVVDNGGFAPAGRKLGMPKSKLSRRIALLEERLGVRLVQRSTRHFVVTEIGQNYYRHCVAMLVEAEAAEAVIEQSHAAPRGIVRLSCPTGLAAFGVGEMVARFMMQNPHVQVHMEVANRRVDVVSEGFDIGLRVRFPPLEDADLVMKVLGDSSQRLVAHPALLARCAPDSSPEELGRLPTLDLGPPMREHRWTLEGADGSRLEINHHPRLVTTDLATLHHAALLGAGVVQLPEIQVRQDLLQGRLVEVLPCWLPRSGIIHAVFPSRRGLLPAVRHLIDFLATEFAAQADAERAAREAQLRAHTRSASRRTRKSA
jgi:DNA-binding transcriptional LysR family regulator